MFEAFKIVRDRQARIVQALEDTGVAYALSGSNATFLWLATFDASAVRAYRNVEVIIQREDCQRAANALTALGLEAESRADRLIFRNDLVRRDRCSDCALFANEISPTNSYGIPGLEATETINGARVLPLPVLVEFQLSRWTLDDNVDLRDLIDVGLVDQTWNSKVAPELSMRLRHLLDTPDG